MSNKEQGMAICEEGFPSSIFNHYSLFDIQKVLI